MTRTHRARIGSYWLASRLLGWGLIALGILLAHGSDGALATEEREAESAAQPADKRGSETTEELEPERESNEDGEDKDEAPAVAPKWRPLFDGKSLENWKVTQFGGQGEVRVDEGKLILELGTSLTGVNYTGPLIRTNYEVELEAQRLAGIDFFCGFTFPVGDSYCSFIVGGWAGGVVGLSSIDGRDASQNDTTKYMSFQTGRWYRIRVRVTDDVIRCWIDDKSVVYQRLRDHRISTRAEVDLSQPFGFSTWETTAALRNIRIRELPENEVKEDRLP